MTTQSHYCGVATLCARMSSAIITSSCHPVNSCRQAQALLVRPYVTMVYICVHCCRHVDHSELSSQALAARCKPILSASLNAGRGVQNWPHGVTPIKRWAGLTGGCRPESVHLVVGDNPDSSASALDSMSFQCSLLAWSRQRMSVLSGPDGLQVAACMWCAPASCSVTAEHSALTA